jgi:transcriptional regulator with PAS, ATPase and Fis domain
MVVNNLLKQALESFPNFVVVDADGIIVYMNNIYAKFLGIKQADAIGNHVSKVIPNTRMDIIIKTGIAEIGSIMKFYDHENKKNVTLVCNRIPIIDGGKVIGAVAATTLNNIFEINTLYDELERIKEENKTILEELESYKMNFNSLNSIIGTSEAIKEIKKSITDYAKSNLPILITGETGVGKEVFANAVHQLSNRFANNYVKINCAAIPSDLLESELFGYAEGAFSGAAKGGKIGKFELANNGTILLDEIGDMPMSLQTKLLRVLQENEVERLGSIKTIRLNIRFICSTNSNLEELVEKKQFREDLYYRINAVKITIPPLRERISDVPALCNHFITKVNSIEGLNIQGISEDVINIFQKYCWPGNVRELEHTIHRASVLAKDGIIQTKHIQFLHDRLIKKKEAFSIDNSLKGIIENVEADAIIGALKKTYGNKSEAAKILDIDRSLLYSKMKKYNIEAK